MAALPATVFLSAFLLFFVQPMMGRYILPWFGGGPAVWTACLLFFQSMLLAGYAYAHGLATALSRRMQAGVHITLLLFSLLFLPVRPAEHWKAATDSDPTGRIVLLLFVTLGLPGLLLSSTGPLLQRWASRQAVAAPYRLYALSNAGSLLALVSFPVAVETTLTRGQQVGVWSALYGLFVAACGTAAWRFGQSGREMAPPQEGEKPGPGRIAYWLALSLCGSVLLLATTNQMSQEVAVSPFLWVLPLALYLLTFMLCFDSEQWHDRRWVGLAAGIAAAAACALVAVGGAVPLRYHLAAYSLALFAVCMACHGELVRAKPSPRYLTLFYLMVAVGGALGGALVALLMPRVAATYVEYPLALGAGCVLTFIGWARERAWTRYPSRPVWPRAALAALALGVGAAAVALEPHEQPGLLAQSRNFYGLLRVSEEPAGEGALRSLTHGRITHGVQYTEGQRRFWPTSYFGRESGVGLALEQHPRRLAGQPLRVGIIGLGVGTLAAYGRPGDAFRFYEINPAVVGVAERHFTYRRDSAARVETILGDARVRLEREPPQAFDVLVVDAFNSDSIPMHLLTAEAADLYRRHLKTDGVLALHISNQHVELGPVAHAIARRLHWTALQVESGTSQAKAVDAATWVLITQSQPFLHSDRVEALSERLDVRPHPWTDDFASLWGVLKR